MLVLTIMSFSQTEIFFNSCQYPRSNRLKNVLHYSALYIATIEIKLSKIVFFTYCKNASSVAGVFQNSAEDLENGDDVYEAIGGLLHDVAADRSEKEIK